MASCSRSWTALEWEIISQMRFSASRIHRWGYFYSAFFSVYRANCYERTANRPGARFQLMASSLLELFFFNGIND